MNENRKSMTENGTLDAELASLLAREKKLKQIRSVQIRIQKIEGKMLRGGIAPGRTLFIIGGFVSQQWGIEWGLIIAKCKTTEIVSARQAVCYLGRRAGLGLKEIGRQMHLGHGSVHHSWKRVGERMSVEAGFKKEMDRLQAMCFAELHKQGLLPE